MCEVLYCVPEIKTVGWGEMMPLFAAGDTMAVAMSASDRTIRENALNAMSRNALTRHGARS